MPHSTCNLVPYIFLYSMFVHSRLRFASTGRSSVPEIFFNDRLIGGLEELEQLDKEGKLDAQIQECLQGPHVDFPPSYRKPKSEEFLKVRERERERGRVLLERQ